MNYHILSYILWYFQRVWISFTVVANLEWRRVGILSEYIDHVSKNELGLKNERLI